MPFSEQLKIEVKRKAHYKCCICELSKPLQVHNIIPENENGTDTIENAAPLCADCHDLYGGNPDKRKWLREKRDFWYEKCEKTFYYEDVTKLERIYEIIEKQGRKYEKSLDNIKSDMRILQETINKYSNILDDKISQIEQTPDSLKINVFTEISTISSVVASTATAIDTEIDTLNQRIYDIYDSKTCPKCGKRIVYFLVESTDRIICPKCKTPI